MVKGIDISHWQRAVNFNQVKSSGIDFVIAKISQNKGKDNMFSTYYANGHNILKFGGYIYNKVFSVAEAKEEAMTAINALQGKQLPCGVWLDMEDSSLRRLPKQTLSDIINCESSLLHNAGYNVGIYCNLDWYKNVLDSAVLATQYPFWIARYPSGDDGTIRESLSPKAFADIWQYSSKGKVNGIAGNVDLDILYTSFDTMFNKKPVTTYPTLRKGSRGEAVKILQQRLNSFGYPIVCDSIFGNNTYNAVIAFQGEKNLVKDGIVGSKTWTALMQCE